MTTYPHHLRAFLRSGVLLIALAMLPLLVSAEDDAAAAEYDRLLALVQGGQATEADVLSVLQQAIDVRRPYAANIAVKSHLQRQREPSVEVLRLAAEVAAAAGDLRTAVSRLKGYLKLATPSPEASDVAARLYQIDVELLRNGGDAYGVMSRIGGQFRESIAARQYDSWFVAQAISRDQLEEAADRLALAFADAKGLQKSLYYGSLKSLVEATLRLYQRADRRWPTIPKLPSLLANVPKTDPDYRYLDTAVSYLTFRLAAQEQYDQAEVKDTAVLSKLFAPVAATAIAWYDHEPTHYTVERLDIIFSGQYNGTEWAYALDQKRPIYQHIWDSYTSEEDKKWFAFYAPHGYPRQAVNWESDSLLAKDPWMARWRNWDVTYQNLRRVTDRQAMDKQRERYAGTKSPTDRYLSALAAHPQDPLAAFDELAPHTSVAQVGRLAYNLYYDVARNWYGDTYDHQALLVHAWQQWVTRTPIIHTQTNLLADYVGQFWTTYRDHDLELLAALYHAIDWVPLSGGERKEVFGKVAADYRKWCDGIDSRIDKLAASGKPTDDEAAQLARLRESVKRRPQLDALLGQVAAAAVTATATGPTPVCEQLRQLMLAVAAKSPDVAQQAGAAYDAVRQSQEAEPFNWETVRHIAQYADLSTIHRMLTQECSEMAADRRNYASAVLYGLRDVRAHLPGRVHDHEVAFAEFASTLFAKTLTSMMAAKRFDSNLCFWMYHLCRNPGEQVFLETMAAIVEGDWLRKSGCKPSDGNASYTVNEMRMIRDRFTKLDERYPRNGWFDDQFIAESRESGVFDPRYWENASDSKGKITAYLLAEWAQGRQPIGADPGAWHYRLGGGGGREAYWAAQKKVQLGSYVLGLWDLDAMPAFHEAANKERRAEWPAKVAAYLDAAAQQPGRYAMPSVSQFERVEGKDLTAAELDALLRLPAACLYVSRDRTDRYNRIALRELPRLLHDGLMHHQRSAELFRVMPHFWRILHELRSDWAAPQFQLLNQRIQKMLKDGEHELVAAYCNAALTITEKDLSTELRHTLIEARAQAVAELGGISVPESDPRYPIFAAQIDYASGNYESAWRRVTDNRAQLRKMYRELDLSFVVWLVDRHTEVGEFSEAEELARSLIRWVESSSVAFDVEERGRLLLVYADISFGRREYPRARAQYERIVHTDLFKGTRVAIDAQLRIAEVDRLTNNFAQAIERLEDLQRDADPYVRSSAMFQLALIRFDEAAYEEVRTLLDQVLILQPDHPDARILEGKLQLAVKRLEDATQLDLGIVSTQRILVPGKPLRINLIDRNLAIVGKTTDIEVRAWTSAGDEELFNLLPWGDARDRFQGSLPTALAPIQKGDKVLQVFGDDIVNYDFSPAFKARNNIGETSVTALSIAVNAEFYAAAGRIKSKEEQEEEALRRLLESKRSRNQGRNLTVERAEDRIKPGNKIYLRVVDADRSLSAEVDTIAITALTSSGDRIDAVPLTETEGTSGIFEGIIQTAPAQPTAFASDSAEGSDPNTAISPREYEPWVAALDSKRPKTVGVDLNDNVALGVLKIVADVPDRKLKDFLLQTSFNNDSWQNAAAWPRQLSPWDGSIQLDLAEYRGEQPEDIAGWLDWGHMTAGVKRAVIGRIGFTAQFNQALVGQHCGLNNPHQTYVGRLRGAFYLDSRQRRTFSIKHGELPAEVSWTLRIDDQAIASADVEAETDASSLRLTLDKGVHLVEILLTCGRANAEFTLDLLVDTAEEPFVQRVPAVWFNPEQPALAAVRGQLFGRAFGDVTAAEDGTSFEIAFAPETRARLFRLLLLNFETDAPAIRRLTLSDTDGAARLPTPYDFGELRSNSVLEILPGDKITLQYADPNTVGKGFERQERFLHVTYADAEVKASFITYVSHGNQPPEPSYTEIVRYLPNEPVVVFIHDPDGDVSAEPDAVPFRATVGMGEPQAFEARETEPQSGIFTCRLFPLPAIDEQGQPTPTTRPTDLLVSADDALAIAYLDKENTDPGVPWERQHRIEQVFWQDPVMTAFESTIEKIEVEEAASEDADPGPAAGQRRLVLTHPEAPAAEPVLAFIDGPKRIELVFPTITLSRDSTATLYAQTSSARKSFADQLEQPFDIRVPGTIKLTRHTDEIGESIPPPWATEIRVTGLPEDRDDPLYEGIYTFDIPTELGQPLTYSPAVEGARVRTADGLSQQPLLISGADLVHVGFKYTDEAGTTQWLTQTFQLTGVADFQVLDRTFENPVAGIHVGETLYFQVTDAMRDTTDLRDEIPLTVASGVSEPMSVILRETFEHTGVFRGVIEPRYIEERPAAAAAGAADAGGPQFYVKYGDVISCTYESNGQKIIRDVDVFRGADGDVVVFTKRFKDPEIAVQTQFTLAECYFELAKKHRALKQGELAQREIAQGKRLLEEALRDFPDSTIRAQADYLLANLSLEFAGETEDEDQRKRHYLEAIARFADIVAASADSPYAAKAQYKKALTYEKMGELDQACEEYVKLSYRYPDNELVAETIARLGQYFWTKGQQSREQANATADEVAAYKANQEAQQMFRTAGEVFGRLAPKFPTHQLAGKATLLSGQAYMQAESFEKAIETLLNTIDTYGEDKELCPEAMYWCADSYTRTDDLVQAYRMFKRLTWDFPQSNWAKFARGRLASEEMSRIEATAND